MELRQPKPGEWKCWCGDVPDGILSGPDGMLWPVCMECASVLEGETLSTEEAWDEWVAQEAMRS